jgi:AmmeMemoRadiSam system protein A
VRPVTESAVTSDADRQRLLRIARDALAAHVANLPLPVLDLGGAAARRAGAFVTLRARGDLRGCIGHVEADQPLGLVVARSAVAAGSSDPRFSGVTPAELVYVRIELSILGPLAPVARVEEIQVGIDGLIVELDWRRGLLLPQVAAEWRWDRETFVAETCRKAGLARDEWRKGAKIWKFQAEVFGEDDTPEEIQ